MSQDEEASRWLLNYKKQRLSHFSYQTQSSLRRQTVSMIAVWTIHVGYSKAHKEHPLHWNFRIFFQMSFMLWQLWQYVTNNKCLSGVNSLCVFLDSLICVSHAAIILVSTSDLWSNLLPLKHLLDINVGLNHFKIRLQGTWFKITEWIFLG